MYETIVLAGGEEYQAAVMQGLLLAARDAEVLGALRGECKKLEEISRRVKVTNVRLAGGVNEGVEWTLSVRTGREGTCLVFSEDGGTNSTCDTYGVTQGFPVIAQRLSTAKRTGALTHNQVHFIFGSASPVTARILIQFDNGSVVDPRVLRVPEHNRVFFVAHVPRDAPKADIVAFSRDGSELGRLEVPPQPSSGSP